VAVEKVRTWRLGHTGPPVAEAELASGADPWAALLARGFPLTVVGNAGDAGANPARYPNLFVGFAVLLRDGLASVGSDGRLRLTDAGRQAEEDEWLEGWG
jgi:hypothetical protein